MGKVGDTKISRRRRRKKGNPNHRIGFLFRLNGCIKFGQERRRLRTPDLFIQLLLENDKRFVVSTQRTSEQEQVVLGQTMACKIKQFMGNKYFRGNLKRFIPPTTRREIKSHEPRTLSTWRAGGGERGICV